jgi:hypothetical protein
VLISRSFLHSMLFSSEIFMAWKVLWEKSARWCGLARMLLGAALNVKGPSWELTTRWLLPGGAGCRAASRGNEGFAATGSGA